MTEYEEFTSLLIYSQKNSSSILLTLIRCQTSAPVLCWSITMAVTI